MKIRIKYKVTKQTYYCLIHMYTVVILNVYMGGNCYNQKLQLYTAQNCS